MKSLTYLLLLLALGCSRGLSAQTTITLAGKNCARAYVYAFNGTGFQQLKAFEKTPDGKMTVTLDDTEATFRYIGANTRDVLPLIVGNDANITVTGTCGRLKSQAKITGSPINDRYAVVKAAFARNGTRTQTATRAYVTAQRGGDEAAVAAARDSLVAIDAEKLTLLNATNKEFPILGRIVSLNTYISYVHGNQDRFGSELDYFVNTYFQHVDYQDAGYGALPWTYEANNQFAKTLSQAVPGEQLGDVLVQVSAKWPAGSAAKLFALSGNFAALHQLKHPGAVKVADAILAEEFKSFATVTAPIEAQAASLSTFRVGAEAPNFSGPTPDGDELALESLRGKVVLIDFWASWCGPCRRENPNVVKVYAKYRDQGFEILGVSLDKTKDRWIKAIAEDGLTWPQISDLRGWQSKYAKLYGVSSIPQTVLLDAEGKIIARNLRGAQLEAKLAEIFAGK